MWSVNGSASDGDDSRSDDVEENRGVDTGSDSGSSGTSSEYEDAGDDWDDSKADEGRVNEGVHAGSGSG